MAGPGSDPVEIAPPESQSNDSLQSGTDLMNLAFDLKYAWRLLMKSWGYSLMCASVVALSVGLAVFAYTLAYSQLMKPIGIPNSDRWYSLQIAADATAT